jgi:hypothetical protein
MTSPVSADSYLPVDPDSNVVHDYTTSSHSEVRTKCGRYIPWVKSIALIPLDYEWCSTCHPWPLDDDRPCPCGVSHTVAEHGYDPDNE